jgi:hypothetical protein
VLNPALLQYKKLRNEESGVFSGGCLEYLKGSKKELWEEEAVGKKLLEVVYCGDRFR